VSPDEILSSAARLLRQGAPVNAFVAALDDRARADLRAALASNPVASPCNQECMDALREECEAEHAEGYLCTRWARHAGPHVACSDAGSHALRVWC